MGPGESYMGLFEFHTADWIVVERHLVGWDSALNRVGRGGVM